MHPNTTLLHLRLPGGVDAIRMLMSRHPNAKFVITVSTVNCIVSVILMRLNLSDRTQAAVTAWQCGLVHL
jgi:hypothetical protein